MPATSTHPSSPRPARQLLERAGLRCSMSRLKVLDLLYYCRSGTALELHACLQEQDLDIPVNCIRQALRRLHKSGVLERDEQKRYRLALDLDSLTGGQPTRH
ncbi:hypothetical protein D3C76_737980 [compost metagenome]|uniref:Ferric uptake regulator family protein n=1 Tax=Pseudomonas jinjuensis TaxID=198616 RepID=A0A1H0LY40_9PSED|nr:hypothetical protein [Pseudomonas jinjuensis]SDO73118.1 hypothetical protein SAMN05216193_11513 [Pseudomonas jinjuensis]